MGSKTFKIGDVGQDASTSAIPIYDCHDLETIPLGTVISPLGDYQIVWDEASGYPHPIQSDLILTDMQDCVPPSALEPWRRLGDPLCDEVVLTLHLRPGQDGLQRILEHLELPTEDQAECVKRFWDEIARDPPWGISAIDLDHPSSNPTPTKTSNDMERVAYTPYKTLINADFDPPPSLAEGQAVFWRYAPQIFVALRHYSLAGGFSAVGIMSVLKETNYLTGDQRDKTYKRLLETTQAIMDYMNDMTPITGIGWKSAIRVRMLHSSVRQRIWEKRGAFNAYDEAKSGIPINQEDLIFTLGSFAVAPLWSLGRIGFRLSPEEELAYVAAWRHVGYYLGINPSTLLSRFTSTHRASQLFASQTMHLFSTNTTPKDPTSSHTYRLIEATANRPPRYTTLEGGLALSRFLLGDGLADRLALPSTSRLTMFKMRVGFTLQKAMASFGRSYRPGWEMERVMVTRGLVRLVVCNQLGGRRTKFAAKVAEGPADLKAGSDGGESRGGRASGELRTGEEEDDESEDELDIRPEAREVLLSRWRWVLAEMLVVVLGMTILGFGLGFVLVQRLLM